MYFHYRLSPAMNKLLIVLSLAAYGSAQYKGAFKTEEEAVAGKQFALLSGIFCSCK